MNTSRRTPKNGKPDQDALGGAVTMAASTYEAFRRLVYEQSGINLGSNKTALVASRVGKRMRALNLSRFEDYLQLVRDDTRGNEITLFVDSISTNVTSFFRENHHFTLLRELLDTWRQEGQSRFRVWSAACSTGEEPYTIAMTMAEALDRQKVDWRILATDISTRVLQHAMAGQYSAEKMESVPPAYRSRFTRRIRGDRGDQYAIVPEIREKVLFRQINLAQTPYVLRGPLDIIFCRNVMIYFDNDVRRGLLNEFFRLLRPGGMLLVGHAESLTGLTTDFRPIRASIYTKP